jgi:hypothetical protein
MRDDHVGWWVARVSHNTLGVETRNRLILGDGIAAQATAPRPARSARPAPAYHLASNEPSGTGDAGARSGNCRALHPKVCCFRRSEPPQPAPELAGPLPCHTTKGVGPTRARADHPERALFRSRRKTLRPAAMEDWGERRKNPVRGP